MKVVVFGGSGFIGSHIADELSEKGHKVTIYDVKESPYLRKDQKMVVGDILDAKKVQETIKGSDAVYSFAGIASLDDATTQPIKTIEQNILGHAGILEACVKEKVKRIMYASTIYVYSTLGGFYKCSKQSAEIYTEEYQKRYGLDFTILRYGTVYGPRANEKNSVYRYIKQALENKKIVCTGKGDESREYIHVKDVAKLSVDALSDEFQNKHVIITGHHPTRFKDMLYTIREMLNNEIEVEFKNPEKDSAHYSLTPYSYTPRIGKKLVSNYYTDLGQGLLECINDMKNKG